MSSGSFFAPAIYPDTGAAEHLPHRQQPPGRLISWLPRAALASRVLASRVSCVMNDRTILRALWMGISP